MNLKLNANVRLAALAVVGGFASALLMLAIASGASLSLVLFLFSPLPIMLVGIGWDHRAAALAGAVGTVVLGVVLGWAGARGYLASIAVPGWLLSFIAMRRWGRNEPDAATGWCRPGTLVLWTAGLGALLVFVSVPAFGLSLSAYRAGMSHAFEVFLRRETDAAANAPVILPSGGDATHMAALFALILPPLGAASWMVVTLVNLWLAARIARAAGHLARPWPPVPTLTLPRATLIVFAAAIGLGFAPGFTGLFGQVVGATLFVAFVLVGLAVVHAGTHGFKGRFFVLLGVYLMLAIQMWTALILAVLGVADQIIGLRHRLDRPRPPPSSS